MAKKSSGWSLVGSWAFLLGVVLAVVLGWISMEPWMRILLVIIGVIVGLLNITAHEAMGFLTASAILVIVTALSGDVFAVITFGDTPVLSNIMEALMTVFVPATIIVALRAVFGLAKN